MAGFERQALRGIGARGLRQRTGGAGESDVRMTHGASGNDAALRERFGEGWRDTLDGVLMRHLELYGELDAMCDRQRGLIEAGDTDRLVGLLAERSRVVEAIAEAVERFAPFGLVWDEVESALGETERRGVRRRLDAVASLARSVAERDTRDSETITAKRNELADRLAGLDKSKAAVSAYAGPRPSGARYQDREG